MEQDKMKIGVIEQDIPAHDRYLHINDVPAVVLPEGYRLHLLPELMDQPSRIKREVKLLSPESFVEYVKHHCIDSRSSVYADARQFKIRAILDHHRWTDKAMDEPGFCEHQARYDFDFTNEWAAWNDSDGKWMSQADFAEFIEEQALDIVKPNAATMLDIARNMSATRTASFQSAIRESSGDVHFAWSSDTKVNGNSLGTLEIPERFEIVMAPFVGCEKYSIEAVLRYRIKTGEPLTLSYRLMRKDRVLEDAFKTEWARIAGKLAGEFALYEGRWNG